MAHDSRNPHGTPGRPGAIVRKGYMVNCVNIVSRAPGRPPAVHQPRHQPRHQSPGPAAGGSIAQRAGAGQAGTPAWGLLTDRPRRLATIRLLRQRDPTPAMTEPQTDQQTPGRTDAGDPANPRHADPVAAATPPLPDDRLDALRQLIPEAFTADAAPQLDWDKLRDALGQVIDDRPDRYRFEWAGKRDAIRQLQRPCQDTLVPVPGESVNFDTTEHLFIEGDNLEALKLLYKAYAGRVKLIYIDPPYNTGNDFIYEDDYRQPLAAYYAQTGQTDARAADSRGEAEQSNRTGRIHSAWLNMMYPRLFLARQMLREDGVIFISIDDNEVHHLRLVMNEIFGEENFIGTITWERKRKGSHLSKKFTQKTEYVVIYARSANGIELFGESVGEDEDGPLVKRTNAVKDIVLPAGAIETTLPDQTLDPGSYGRGSSAVELLEPVTVRDGRFESVTRLRGPFVWSQPKIDDELQRGGRFFIRTRNMSIRALKADQAAGFKALSSFLPKEVGTNEDGRSELASLLGVSEDTLPMDYPKPSSLLKVICKAACFRIHSRLVPPDLRNHNM